MSIFKDEYGITMFGGICIAILVIMTIIVLIAGCGAGATKVTCSEFASLNPDYEIQWRLWNGCMIKNSFGIWISVRAFSAVQAEIIGR